jgi:hypothetical protein
MFRLRKTTASGRRDRYEEIVTRRRRELLSELSGAALPESALRILGRCAWAELSGGAWRRLLRLVSGEALLKVPAGESALCVVADDVRAALLHAPHVRPRLVRQLPLIPAAVRTPALLELVDRCSVATERWERLGEDLARAGADRRAALSRQAASVRSWVDLQDFLVKAAEAARDATPFAPAPDLGPRLVPLRNVAEMRREGQAMQNCLGTHHLENAASGERVYYRWIGNRERASVSLWRIPGGYVVDETAGVANAPLSPQTAGCIRNDLVVAFGWEVFDSRRIPPLKAAPTAAGYRRLAALADETFPASERSRVANALRAVLDRPSSEGAGVVKLSAGPYWVKALTRGGSSVAFVWVVSHHSVPGAAAHLDASATRLLEDAGFSWPSAGHDFEQIVAVRDRDESQELADAMLGILHGVYGLSPERRPDLTTYQP